MEREKDDAIVSDSERRLAEAEEAIPVNLRNIVKVRAKTPEDSANMKTKKIKRNLVVKEMSEATKLGNSISDDDMHKYYKNCRKCIDDGKKYCRAMSFADPTLTKTNHVCCNQDGESSHADIDAPKANKKCLLGAAEAVDMACSTVLDNDLERYPDMAATVELLRPTASDNMDDRGPQNAMDGKKDTYFALKGGIADGYW